MTTFSQTVNSIFKVQMLLKLVKLYYMKSDVVGYITCYFSLKMNLGILLKILNSCDNFGVPEGWKG